MWIFPSLKCSKRTQNLVIFMSTFTTTFSVLWNKQIHFKLFACLFVCRTQQHFIKSTPCLFLLERNQRIEPGLGAESRKIRISETWNGSLKILTLVSIVLCFFKCWCWCTITTQVQASIWCLKLDAMIFDKLGAMIVIDQILHPVGRFKLDLIDFVWFYLINNWSNLTSASSGAVNRIGSRALRSGSLRLKLMLIIWSYHHDDIIWS